MGFLSRVATVVKSFRQGNPLNNPAIPLGGPGFWAWLFSGDVTESGEQINDFTALQQITVYICVRIIAESVASLPLKVYERLDKGRKEAVDNPIYDLLRYQPNPEMTASTFFETMGGCLALTGNCYAQIIRNGLGNVWGLYPLHPHKTKPMRLDGRLIYQTTDGESLGKSRYLWPEDILHVPLFCFDGVLGLSPVQQAKQSIGLARAAEKYGARFFGNGSRPGGVLSPKAGQKLDEKTMSQIRETWLSTQGGINQGKTAVLPGEWNYQQIGLSPDESQFLESRKFSRADICGLFRVPPHMAGDTSRLSNSNHEQQSLQFVTDTLRPYVTKFEQEIHRKLMPHQCRNAGRFFVQFDVRERLRGDFQTTMQGYSLGKQWGFYNTNMILEDLGENPIGPVGDIFWAPVNMSNAEKLLPGNGGLDPPPAPALPPSPDPASDPEPTNSEGEGPGPEAKSLDRYLPAYIGLFRDAVRRICKRDKRDIEAVSLIFKPALESLAAQSMDAWAATLGLGDAWNQVAEVVSERLGRMAARAGDWSLEKADQIAMMELTQAIRAVEISTASLAAIEAAKRKVGS